MTGIEVGWDRQFSRYDKEMTEVAVGQDQDQGQVQIEMGLDASDVENDIIYQRSSKHENSRKRPVRTNAIINGHRRTGQCIEVVCRINIL